MPLHLAICMNFSWGKRLHVECCTGKERSGTAWLVGGMRGIRKKTDKGGRSLCSGKEMLNTCYVYDMFRNHKMEKWFLNKKWLNMKEKVACNKILRCANKACYRSRQIFALWHNSPTWARAALFLRCLCHTQRHITVGRTTLDEGSVRRREFYLTTHNTNERQTSMPLVRFEP